MAKDILGREIAPGTPAAAYRDMAENAAITQFARKRAANPAQTLGQDARAIASGVGQGVRALGNAVNQAPKVVGIPAAGLANTVAKGVANFQTGFTGEKYKPQTFEALTLGQMWDRTWKPGAATAAAAPAPAPAAAPAAPAAPAASTYTPGAGLPSAAQVASDKSRATAAQTASDSQLGITPQAQPTNINVRRQPNGVLAFSGAGGAGGVNYTGLPSWTSAQGGAGQGAVGSGFNLAEQNARMATALQGIQSMDQQTKANEMIDAMASGAGGAVGVARNKAAMQALGPLIERQMSNENATGVAKLGAETTRRGQDKSLQGEMARIGASVYGTDVGAQTADADRQVEMDKVRASVLVAKAKAAAGKPLSQTEQLGLQIFEGKQFKTPEARKAAMAEYVQMFKGGDPLSQMIAELMAAQQEQ